MMRRLQNLLEMRILIQNLHLMTKPQMNMMATIKMLEKRMMTQILNKDFKKWPNV